MHDQVRRFTHAGEGHHAKAAERAQALERPRVLAPKQDVADGHLAVAVVSAGFRDLDQAVRVAIWQRSQKNSAKCAEHGGARADSQRHREHRRSEETGRLRQNAYGISNVPQGTVKHIYYYYQHLLQRCYSAPA